MNRPPSILVDTGFEVDQNGALDEIVIPKVVATCNVPRKVTFEGQTLNWIPSNASTLQELSAPNVVTLNSSICSGFTELTDVSFNNLETINASPFYNCSKLTTVNMPKLTSITDVSTGNHLGGVFNRCLALTSINLPSLQSITTPYNTAGTFAGCTGLTQIILPSLTNISLSSSSTGTFYNCTSLVDLQLPSLTTILSSASSQLFTNCSSLQTLNLPELSSIANATSTASQGAIVKNNTSLQTLLLPKIKTIAAFANGFGAFSACTGLTSIQLGSAGNPVVSIASNAFYQCTQSGLTITVYTQGGAALSGSPWGATNATIEYEEA